MKLVTSTSIQRAAHWCRGIALGIPFLFLPAASLVKAAACPNKVATVGTPVWNVADCIESIVDDIRDTGCVGTVIRTLPVTLSSPGQYSVGANLSWGGAGAAITVTTDGVEIDFHCLNLDIVAGGAPRVGIRIGTGAGQCTIRNGRISTITMGAAAPSTVMIEKQNGGGSDSFIIIDNMRFVSDVQANSVPAHFGITAVSSNAILISNCEFFQGTTSIILTNCSQFKISDCDFNQVFNTAIDVNLLSYDGLIKNNAFTFCGSDISLNDSSSMTIEDCNHLSSGRIAGQNAVSFLNVGDATVRNCTVDSAGVRSGVSIGTINAYRATTSSRLTFQNNIVNFPTGTGFLFDAATAFSQIIECVVNNPTVSGINVTDPSNMVVSCAVSRVLPATAYPGAIPPVALIASGAANVAAANNKWINIDLP